jgi:hypothetical protein
LEGYAAKALDSKMGQVEELLITPADWRTAYLVLKTRNWLPG